MADTIKITIGSPTATTLSLTKPDQSVAGAISDRGQKGSDGTYGVGVSAPAILGSSRALAGGPAGGDGEGEGVSGGGGGGGGGEKGGSGTKGGRDGSF